MGNSLVLKRPQSYRPARVDRITNYKGIKGDSITFDLASFGISPRQYRRAAIGFGNCKAAIIQGALREEAFLYQFKTGELFFNENGSKPGLGNGGLICILEGAPSLGAIYFDF
jgi:hypothetical protein